MSRSQTLCYRPVVMRNVIIIRNWQKTLSLACALVFVIGVGVAWPESAAANPPRYQTQGQVPAQNVQFQAPGSNPPTLTTPGFENQSIINSPPPISATPPGAMGQPPVTYAPQGVVAPPPYAPQGVVAPPPYAPQGTIQSPNPTLPPGYDPFQTTPIIPMPGFGATQAPPPTIVPPIIPYQTQTQIPPVIQPQVGGVGASGDDWWPAAQWPSIAWSRLRHDPNPRVLQGLRFRHTYIYGNNGNELGVNDVEIATTWVFGNFWGGSSALQLTPGFIFSFWSGPDTAATGVDLPARAYNAYLTTDYITDTSKQAGMESSITLAFASDFNAVTSDSLRITGTILGWQQVNCYTTAKLGVEYYDRIDLKLLPAFGVYMTPNADLKFDIYFPRPKLAARIPNSSGFDAWSYIGGEYGGGNWTIRREAGFNDRVDVNDVRAFFGAEWMGPKGRTGFMELGYVFDRNLVFRSDVQNKTIIQDSIMFRSGFAF